MTNNDNDNNLKSNFRFLLQSNINTNTITTLKQQQHHSFQPHKIILCFFNFKKIFSCLFLKFKELQQQQHHSLTLITIRTFKDHIKLVLFLLRKDIFLLCLFTTTTAITNNNNINNINNNKSNNIINTFLFLPRKDIFLWPHLVPLT